MRAIKYSGIKWIGAIPESWDVIKLKYLFSIVGGNGFPDTLQGNTEGDYPFCKVSDINGVSDYVDTASNWVSQSVVDENHFSIVPTGSIIMAKIGAALAKNHRKINTVSCCIDNNTQALVPKRDDSIRFLFYLSKCIDMSWFDNNSTVPSINNPKLLNFFVPDAPQKEQTAIASLLDSQSAKIETVMEQTQASIEGYKKLKQAVITQAVTKGIRPNRPMKDSGVEWIGTIPKDWKCIKFKYIASVKSNLVSPEEYGDYPQISPENIEKGTGRLLPYKTVLEVGIISGNHLFYKGQILYSKIRPILNKVIVAPFDGLCSADMYPIETVIDKYFLLYSLRADSFLANIRLLTEDRVKMPKINQEELAEIFFAIPPEEEQQEIVSYLDKKSLEIDLLLQQKEELLIELESYKKSLIYEYVTGKKEA